MKKMSYIFCLFLFQVKRIRRKFTTSFYSAYYSKKIINCGDGLRINGDISLTGLNGIIIGRNIHIGSNAFIRGEGGLTIEDNTHISRNLTLYTINHNYEGECLPYDNSFRSKQVFIGRNVWIGMNVTILPGSHIEEGCIIGAGCVIHGNIPKFSIVGAAPYHFLKKRNIEHYTKLDNAKLYGGVDGKAL